MLAIYFRVADDKKIVAATSGDTEVLLARENYTVAPYIPCCCIIIVIDKCYD
jgi:hypothetical protein